MGFAANRLKLIAALLGLLGVSVPAQAGFSYDQCCVCVHQGSSQEIRFLESCTRERFKWVGCDWKPEPIALEHYALDRLAIPKPSCRKLHVVYYGHSDQSQNLLATSLKHWPEIEKYCELNTGCLTFRDIGETVRALESEIRKLNRADLACTFKGNQARSISALGDEVATPVQVRFGRGTPVVTQYRCKKPGDDCLDGWECQGPRGEDCYQGCHGSRREPTAKNPHAVILGKWGEPVCATVR